MKKNISGQSLFEIILALAISVLIITSLVTLAANAVRNSTYSKNKTQATRYSQEATEWLRGERDTNWDNLYDKAAVNPPQVYCMKSLSWADATIGLGCSSNQVISGTVFKREVSFERRTVLVGGLPKNIIDASVRVYWQDAQGVHEVRSATSFTDWRER